MKREQVTDWTPEEFDVVRAENRHHLKEWCWCPDTVELNEVISGWTIFWVRKYRLPGIMASATMLAAVNCCMRMGVSKKDAMKYFEALVDEVIENHAKEYKPGGGSDTIQ